MKTFPKKNKKRSKIKKIPIKKKINLNVKIKKK